MQKPLLILDLDLTLIYGTEDESAGAPDFCAEGFTIHIRPKLADFLRTVAYSYRIAIWTAAAQEYASAIVDRAVRPHASIEFVWCRDHCTLRYDPLSNEECWVKDLTKLGARGFALDRVLIVDDNPAGLRRNCENHVPIIPFTGDSNDDELISLADFLKSIATCADFRSIEKRFWRSEQQRNWQIVDSGNGYVVRAWKGDPSF